MIVKVLRSTSQVLQPVVSATLQPEAGRSMAPRASERRRSDRACGGLCSWERESRKLWQGWRSGAWTRPFWLIKP